MGKTVIFFAKLGLRNALKYRRRSIEVGLIILIGAFVLTTLGGFMAGFIDSFMNDLLTSTAHAKVFKQGYYQKQEISPLELSITGYPQVMAGLQSADPSALVSPSISAGAVVSRGDESLNMLCRGVQPYADGGVVFPAYREFNETIRAGHFFRDNTERGILVSTYVAVNLGCSVGDNLVVFTSDSYGSFNAVELPVIGIFRTGFQDTDEGVCLADLRSMQQLAGLENSVTEIALFFTDPETADTFPGRIGNVLRENGLEYYSWRQLLGGMLYAIQAGKMFEYVIYLIFLVVAALGITNTVLLSVFDRIRDIGTLRAIGYTRNNVTAMLLFELMFVGLAGAAIGTLLGGGVVYYFSVHGLGFSEASRELASGYRIGERIYPAFKFVYIAVPFLVSSLVPLVSALYPLAIVRKMKVKDALGYA